VGILIIFVYCRKCDM